MNLNVGCGADKWGDVRLDMSRDHWMTIGESSANLIADARYLPFRDECFDETRIHEVVEHIEEWRKALLECCRVSTRLSVTVPINSYMPKQYINWILPLLTGPRNLLKYAKKGNLKHVIRLRQRTMEHRWQFDVGTLTSVLKEAGFDNINVEGTDYYFLVDFLKLLKKANSWKITAIRK